MTTDKTQAEDTEEESTELAVWRPLPALPAQAPDMPASQYILGLMEMLPPQPGDVIEAIAQAILDAPNMQAQNAVWESTSSKDVVGKEYIWHSCHLQPSDYEDSWTPWYLVCKVTDLETKEDTVVTTGSFNLMTALVPAQVLGRLPWQGRIVGPKRGKTKAGRVPLHMMWIAKVERIIETPEED